MFRPVAATLIVLLALGTLLAAPAQAAPREVPAKDVQKITEAMPAKAPATPAKPRKVLVYSHCTGFYHGSIPWGNKALEIMGQKTGAFEAVVSNDLANFEPDKLKEFDAVVFNNSTGELFQAKPPRKPRASNPKKFKNQEQLKKAQAKYQAARKQWEAEVAKIKAAPDRSEALRKSLMDWVKSGHGVVGIHAATDCSYRWKEYGRMMGGYFAGHPWHMLVPIKNDDPTSPINAVFEGKAFEVTDEIYQFNRGVYSRYRQRTLLSLDMSKLKKKGSRKDHDNAISWVKTHGKGRVFYCSLGHRNEIFWNPKVLRHYLAGIQWACGDLKDVSTEPNPLPESEKPKD